MVAHDRTEIQPACTFQNLYLNPLIERIRANGGKVYPESDRPFLLMVDCKTNGEAMYPVLKKVMEPYKDYFCKVEDGEFIKGAILFVLSGDRPLETLPNESNRFVFLDGRIKTISRRYENVLLFGIDFAYVAIKVALKNNKKDIQTGKMTLIKADIENIPFPDQFFDGYKNVEYQETKYRICMKGVK